MVLVAIALVAIAGWSVWQSDQQQGTSNRITRAASTCDQVDRIYSTLLQLMADDQSFSAAQIETMVRQRRDRLTAQNCH